jgi:hypothetical protein
MKIINNDGVAILIRKEKTFKLCYWNDYRGSIMEYIYRKHKLRNILNKI